MGAYIPACETETGELANGSAEGDKWEDPRLHGRNSKHARRRLDSHEDQDRRRSRTKGSVDSTWRAAGGCLLQEMRLTAALRRAHPLPLQLVRPSLQTPLLYLWLFFCQQGIPETGRVNPTQWHHYSSADWASFPVVVLPSDLMAFSANASGRLPAACFCWRP